MGKLEYAPAPESRAVVDLQASYGLFIGGVFVEGQGGGSFSTVNPATEEVLAEVTDAGAADVDRAVRAARAAYRGVWGRMSGADRGKYLFRIARLIQERSRELAVLETLDNGKPIKESRDVDVPWPPRTSSTTRGGPTSWATQGWARTPARSVSSGRSSRGTSRC